MATQTPRGETAACGDESVTIWLPALVKSAHWNNCFIEFSTSAVVTSLLPFLGLNFAQGPNKIERIST